MSNFQTHLLAGLALLLILGCGGGTEPFEMPEPYVNPEPPSGERPTTPLPPSTPTPPPSGPTEPTPPGNTTEYPVVPRGPTPPIGLTFHIGFSENVSATKLQQIYATFVGVNSSIWNISEGQVYIYKMVISDNVAPGKTPAQWDANINIFDSSNLDIVIFPKSSWDLPQTLGLVWLSYGATFGRVGRLMFVPEGASDLTLDHEVSHLIWQLTWAPVKTLEDEYLDGIQDVACLMESNNFPIRWCSAGNHVTQSIIPHSCWTQILLDYTTFTHSGTDQASTSAWVPKVTYQDTP
jgi:hypothetical protein